MLHPIIANENGKARYNEMLNSAEQYRQAKKFGTERTFSLPKLSNLFAGWKSDRKAESESKTAVSPSS